MTVRSTRRRSTGSTGSIGTAHAAGAALVTVAAGLVLAGCGGSTAAAPATSSVLPSATTSSLAPATTSSSVPPTSSAPPTTVSTVATSAAASPTPTAPAATGPCTTSQLAFALGPRTTVGARTTVPLTLRNTAAAACTVRGNPAVDVVDSYGMQAGPAAQPLAGSGSARTVTLGQGESATATFSYVAATSGGASCSPDTAATLLVFAPGAATSAKVPFAVAICTAAADRPDIGEVAAG